MKKRYIFEKITDSYIKTIADVTGQYTNLLHLLYREHDLSNDDEVEWIFSDLEEKCGRFWSYLLDNHNCMFHEDDIYIWKQKK